VADDGWRSGKDGEMEAGLLCLWRMALVDPAAGTSQVNPKLIKQRTGAIRAISVNQPFVLHSTLIFLVLQWLKSTGLTLGTTS
jgi:hypothetical protein